MLLLGHATANASMSASPNPSNTGDYTVSWTPVGGAQSYQLYESLDGGATWGFPMFVPASSNSKSFTDKAPGAYTYRLYSCWAWFPPGSPTMEFQCGYVNGTTTVTVRPPIPTGLTAPATDYNGSYTVSWSSSQGATSYRLQERFNSGSWTQVHSGSATSKARTGRSPGSWSYRVRACLGSNCSNWSGVPTVNVPPPPAAPTGLTAPATDYNGAYTVSWNASSGASSYRLQEKVGSTWTQIYSGSSRSRALSGRSPGTYAYRVRGCMGESVCGSWSSARTVEIPPPPAAPTGLTAPATDYNGAYAVSWNASSGAASYQLEEKVGTTWTQIYSGTSRSRSLSGQAPGTYSYRVRACHPESVCGSWSSARTVTVEPPPAVPTGLTGPVTTECGAYTITWNAAANASSYRLDEWPGTDPWVQIHDDDALSKAIVGKAAGNYSYRVRGCNVESVCSAWSAPHTVTVLGVPDDTDNDCVGDATDAYPSDSGRTHPEIVTTSDGTSFSFSMMLKLQCDCMQGSILEYRIGAGAWQTYRKPLVFDATTTISTRIRSQDENGTAQTITYTRTLPAN